MKNEKFLWSGIVPLAAGILALVLVLMFTACSNLLGSNADKSGLNSAIADADAAKDGVQESANGTDVFLGTKWVTNIELAAFNYAIDDAKGVRDSASADQTQVDAAEVTLRYATNIFNSTTKKDGTKAQTNISALTAKITEAEIAKDSVNVAENAAGAALGEKWATQGQMTALDTAITNAKNAGASADQAAVNAAVSDLNAALTTFTNAVTGNNPGTKTIGFTQDEFNRLKERAAAAKTGVSAAANGDDVPPTSVWVTQTALDALNNTMSAAGSSVSDSAYLALSSALTAFYNAKQPGSTPDIASLQAAINSAINARKDVAIAAGKDAAPKGSAWVTQDQWDALDTAYTTAVTVRNNAGATKNVAAQAASALSAAVGLFNAAKAANGSGTEENGIAISGLGAIYKNGTSVQVALFNDKNFERDPVSYGTGTVTSGSLTVPLESANGPYYIAFSSDGYIIFISRTKAAVSGGTASKTYTDFELYTWSVKFSDMGLPSSMTLDAAIQEYTKGTYKDYTSYKNSVKNALAEELADGYVDLNFLDIALYKNEACTLEFKGTDTVGPDTVVYTKFPLTGGDGGGTGDNRPGGEETIPGGEKGDDSGGGTGDNRPGGEETIPGGEKDNNPDGGKGNDSSGEAGGNSPGSGEEQIPQPANG
jgi:hypothetical protein